MSDKDHQVVPAATVLPTREMTLMHPMVAKIIEKNPSVADIKELAELQRQWQKDEAERAFNDALVELKSALPNWIPRDKVVDFVGNTGKRTYYTHASLAGAMDIIQPKLNEFGFSLTWETDTTKDGRVAVIALLTHRRGHKKTSRLESAPDASGNKNGAQATASAVTLLSRYTGLALLGLATADMKEPGDDGQPPGGKEDRAPLVDSTKNMKAVNDIIAHGKTKQEAEKLVGRPVHQWTGEDLDRLHAWVYPPAPASPAMPDAPPQEPVDEAPPIPPGPPKEPKDGDFWIEVVQVMSSKPENKPRIGKYVVVSLRHADGRITSHNSKNPDVETLAAKMAGKDVIVSCGFSAKANADGKVFVNVETMKETTPEDVPF